ncbi:hypothetical protein HN358_04380 [Candidatus Uhrbacteria bacterium]|jgi:hypothetical protein|nr:hypothetical protein [Candidatus Uhrbacteria bacterium]MBT7717021.1 hypothetical protein [Candidatus Uhrbacteria bacterium]
MSICYDVKKEIKDQLGVIQYKDKIDIKKVRNLFVVVLTFVLLASFLPLIQSTCNQNVGLALGVATSACHNHEMSSTLHKDTETSEAVVPNKNILFLAILTIIAAIHFPLPKTFEQKLLYPTIHRMKFMRWIWAKQRPFLSSKSFIPFFVPMHDA